MIPNCWPRAKNKLQIHNCLIVKIKTERIGALIFMQILGCAAIISKDDLWTEERKLGHMDFYFGFRIFCNF